MRRTALLSLLLLAGCSAPPPAAAPAVVAADPIVITLGDSVPAGTACDCVPFPDRYAGKLSPPARSIDRAQPGASSADVRAQLAEPGLRGALASASVVLVMVGANDLADVFDGGGDEGAFRLAAGGVERNVAAIVAGVRQNDPAPATVLVLGYWNVVKAGAVGHAEYGPDGERSAQTATRYADQALRRAADATGARYVPTEAVFPDDPTDLLGPDGDHPDAAGHEVIAEALYTALPVIPAAAARSGPR